VIRQREALALGAAALAGVQVGAALVASRFVIGDIGPAALALARYAIALLCLLPFALVARRAPFLRRDLSFVMGLGIVQFGLLIALLNLGLRFIDANRAAMLFATFPLMTIVIAALFGRERLSLPKIVGALLAVAGVGSALGVNMMDGVSPGEWTGVAAVLAAALCGALCSVFYRPYLDRYPTLPLGTLSMAAAVVFLLLLAGAEATSTGLPRLDPFAWLVVLFIGVSSSIGYVLWLWALKHAGPTKVTLFLSLSPLTAVVFGAGVLNEPVTAGTVAGLVGVLAGLWIAMRKLEPEPNSARL
jgi:drug/metabolite transporter (DMT)-like permease